MGYSLLCSQLSFLQYSNVHVNIQGIDIYDTLIEQAILNQAKYVAPEVLNEVSLQFKASDFFDQEQEQQDLLDICTFGFSVPMDLLKEKASKNFNNGALVLAPIADIS